jgi:hypothetical protein
MSFLARSNFSFDISVHSFAFFKYFFVLIGMHQMAMKAMMKQMPQQIRGTCFTLPRIHT